MGKITSVNDQEVKNALEGLTRQYFVGNLKKEQNLSFVRDERLEIGITNYEQYTEEPSHYHTEATEYQYMVSGWTKYLDCLLYTSNLLLKRHVRMFLTLIERLD